MTTIHRKGDDHMSTNTSLDSKPVRALAGVADAAAATVRDLSNRVLNAVTDEKVRGDVRGRFSELSQRVSATVTDEKFREDLRQRFSDLPGEARAVRDELPVVVKDIPVKAAELPARAREAFTWERRHELMVEIPARVRDAATQAAQQASTAYDELAGRGEGVVTRWRDEYAENLGRRVVAVRGQVADVADEVADVADQAADDLRDRQGDLDNRQ